ncbi:hypothetical protein BN1195_03818 [Chryseobacterium oranimense G311]|nr:hypothetical protein [Chryseobacterium oranimense]CEJ71469.1 hypothetical protein BN1195_03818 [Chryseobacterium oranimense G311]
MKDEIQDTKSFLQEISDQLYIYISQVTPGGMDWVVHIIVKLGLLCAVFLVVDFIFKFIINFVFRFFKSDEKYPVIRSVYQSKISNSVAHFAALLVVGAVHPSIFPATALPKTNIFINRSINLGLVMILAGMLYRSLTGFRYFFTIKQDFYKIMH